MLFVYIISILLSSISPALPQENHNTGRLLSVSGNKVSAAFDSDIHVGDEIEIHRRIEIIDPISNKVRGEHMSLVARGIIQDIGLGKAFIAISEEINNQKVKLTDHIALTGKGKKMTRPSEPRYGEIQEIKNNTVLTTLGGEDDINEGDIFLVQRTENIYSPATQQVTGTHEVNIGKLSVKSVSHESSVAKIIEMKTQPLTTDRVVKESEYLQFHADNTNHDTVVIESLDISLLRSELKTHELHITALKTTIDSLGNDYDLFKTMIKRELTHLLPQSLSSTTKISVKNNEPIESNKSQCFASYRKALETCLDNHFSTAISQFRSILETFPDSSLSENCLYWIAQSYFSMHEYDKALDGFTKVIDNTQFNHKDDDASIMLGITYYNMNNHEKALQEFKRFTITYPNSEYMPKVQAWIQHFSSL